MKKYHLKKVAYTLSEVLITIGIIGVVAALVIPNLISTSNNKELVSKTKKVANTLSNAYKQAMVLDDITKLNLESDPTFVESLSSHLKTIKPCEGEYDLCLIDGSKVKLGTLSDGCVLDKYEDGKAYALHNTCMDVEVDVNGDKGPNQAGKDRYRFYLTKSGVVADGTLSGCEGLDCTAYVLANDFLWEGFVAIPGCTSQEGSTCNGCDENHVLKNNVCYEKIDGCLEQNGDSCKEYTPIENCKAQDGKTCTTCKEGYTKNESGSCICNKICASDYYLTNACTCVPKSQCKTFEGDKCIECNLHYFLSKTGACVRNDYCIKSSKDGTCDQCSHSYTYKNSDGFCVRLLNCDIANSDGTCNRCSSDAYKTTAGNCMTINRCSKTNSDGTCNTCAVMAYKNSEGKCVEIANCSKANSDGTCATCKTNFYKTSDGMCYGLNTGCRYGNLNGGTNCQCLTGYYKSPDGYCVKINGCNDTNNDGTCQNCDNNNGYYKDADGHCIKINGCKIASNNGTCNECGPAYYKDSSGQCVTVRGYDCRVANSDGTCKECSSDTYKGSDGQCISNPGCTGSTDDGKCSGCSSGYNLVDGHCEQSQ